jgi:hypothetical protein
MDVDLSMLLYANEQGAQSLHEAECYCLELAKKMTKVGNTQAVKYFEMLSIVFKRLNNNLTTHLKGLVESTTPMIEAGIKARAEQKATALVDPIITVSDNFDPIQRDALISRVAEQFLKGNRETLWND